jgi:hypothetical protein
MGTPKKDVRAPLCPTYVQILDMRSAEGPTGWERKFNDGARAALNKALETQEAGRFYDAFKNAAEAYRLLRMIVRDAERKQRALKLQSKFGLTQAQADQLHRMVDGLTYIPRGENLRALYEQAKLP